MNVLSNQDCWTLAFVAQFKVFSESDKKSLLEKLTIQGKELVNLMFDVLSNKPISYSENLKCVNGFINWANSLGKRK